MRGYYDSVFCGPIPLVLLNRVGDKILCKVSLVGNYIAKGFKNGEILTLRRNDIFKKHKFVDYHSEYIGRPDFDKLPEQKPADESRDIFGFTDSERHKLFYPA